MYILSPVPEYVFIAKHPHYPYAACIRPAIRTDDPGTGTCRPEAPFVLEEGPGRRIRCGRWPGNDRLSVCDVDEEEEAVTRLSAMCTRGYLFSTSFMIGFEEPDGSSNPPSPMTCRF